MSLQQTLMFATTGLDLLFFIFVAVKAKNVRARLWFAAVAAVIFLWSLSSLILSYYPTSYFAVVLSYTLGGWISTILFFWTVNLLKINISKGYSVLVVVLSSVVFFGSLLPNVLLKKTMTNNPSLLDLGPLYPIYSTTITFLLLFSAYSFFRYWKTSRGVRHIQLTYILLAILVPTIPIIIVDFISPYFFNQVTVIYFDAIGTSIFVGVASYAVTRYRFLNIRVAFQKNFLKLLLWLGVTTVFFLITWAAFILTNNSHLQAYVVSALLPILILSTYRVVDKIVSRASLLISKNIFDRNFIMPSVVSKKPLEDFINGLKAIFVNDYGFENVEIILLGSQNVYYSSFNEPKKLFVALLRIAKKGEIIIKNELPYKAEEEQGENKEELTAVFQELESMSVDVVIPLGKGSEILGLMLLKNSKKSETMSVQQFSDLRSAQIRIIPVLHSILLSEKQHS